MGLLDRLKNIFGRHPAIEDVQALADFVDTRAAFLMQKGIYEYSRARAGHYAKVLFAEPDFANAVEHARWSAYPLGLAMVGEMAEGVLRPYAGDRRRAAVDHLTRLVLSIFDRYPIPESIGPTVWRTMRDELERHLDLVGGHAPKPVMYIPEPMAERYFNLMPIHEMLRGRDLLTTSNYLRVNLCHMHEELKNRLNGPAVMAELLGANEAAPAKS